MVSARTLGVLAGVEADSDQDGGVVVVLEHRVSENAENEFHEYKLTNKIALLNHNEMDG